MNYKVFDAAYPPSTVPAGMSGVIGYVGGPRALHVWEPAEWLPFQHLRQFPAYVPDLNLDPVTQAHNAVSLVRALGWDPAEPDGRLIIFDTEADVNAPWYRSAAGIVVSAGFFPVNYGSLSVVLGNAAADVLAADWDGIPAIPAGKTLHGVQYDANVSYGGTRIDLDIVDSWFYLRGGVNARTQ
jgi:hypothetical protein